MVVSGSKTLEAEEAEIKNKVISALEDRKFKFRTVRGIAASANIAPDKVVKVIRNEGKSIVVSSRKSADGESLYTTRKHYEESATTREKIMGVILNRVY